MVPSRQMMLVICHQRHVTCLNTHMLGHTYCWVVKRYFFGVNIPVLYQDTDTLQLASLQFSHVNNVNATLSG